MQKTIKNTLAGLVLGISGTFLLIQINSWLTPAPAYHNIDFLVKPDEVNYEGMVISDTTGSLEEIIIHFTTEAAPKVLPAYLDLFRQMSPDVKVYAACPDRATFDVLIKEFKTAGILNLDRFHPLIMECDITTWARDRFLAKIPTGKNFKSVLMLPPRPEHGCEARINDWFVPWKLSSLFSKNYQVEKTGIYFHGGDLINAANLIFVDYNLARQNIGVACNSVDEFTAYLKAKFGKEVILVGNEQCPVPQHHIEMYLTPLDEKTVLAGDPDMALRLLPPEHPFREKIDSSEETFNLFRNVVSQLEAKGFTVVRLPLLPLKQSKVFISYNNVIMETENNRRIIYLPWYNIEELDRAARDIWTARGFDVRPVDVSQMYDLGGAIRCLVNVLKRS